MRSGMIFLASAAMCLSWAGGAGPTPAQEPGSATAIEELVRRLGDPDPGRRCEAAAELGDRDEEAPQFHEALWKAAKDPVSSVRAASFTSLYLTGASVHPSLPAILELVGDADADARRQAAMLVGFLATAPAESVPVLRRALKDPDPSVRATAADALAGFQADAAPAVAEIILLVESEDVDACTEAIQTLKAIGPAARAAEDALLKRVGHPAPLVRGFAIGALHAVGASPERIAPRIEPALADPDDSVRLSAADAWRRVSRDSARSARVLGALLQREGFLYRTRSLEVLVEMGVDAQPALPEVLKWVKTEHDYDRLLVVKILVALAQVDTDAAAGLAMVQHDPDPGLRLMATMGLADARLKTDRSLPILLEELKSPDATRRAQAALDLGKLGPEAAEALSPLMGRVSADPDARVRAAAAGALGLLGPKAYPAWPVLMEAATRDPDEQVRKIASQSWGIVREYGSSGGGK